MRRYWTTREVSDLRALYSSTSNRELGDRLGRAQKAVALMAVKLGLRKSAEYMARRVRYQPGHATWNKGKSWKPAGSEATRFKKGHRGARQKPIGAERVERDSVFVKVAEPNVWESKARVVWRQHFGEIPAGSIVRLKERDNYAPENLLLISRQENARLNTAIRRPRRRPASWVHPVIRAAA